MTGSVRLQPRPRVFSSQVIHKQRTLTTAVWRGLVDASCRAVEAGLMASAIWEAGTSPQGPVCHAFGPWPSPRSVGLRRLG